MMKISKKQAVVGSIIILVIIIVFLFSILAGSGKPNYVSVGLKTENVAEKINLTGQVKASQGVDLGFESQGRIVANYVKVGDKIYTGEPLVSIDSSVLGSQLKQAEAQLDTLNMDTAKSKTDASLQSLYVNSLGSVQKSVTTAKDVIITISDIQFSHFNGQTQQNDRLHEAKAKAIKSLLGQENAAFWSSQNIGQLNGGAFGLVQGAINNQTQSNIDTALTSSYGALQDVGDMINAVPIDPVLTPTERASISLAKTNINLEIITTSANIQAISSLKINNSATITTTSAQIEAAQANIDAIKTQIAKTTIRALFNGKVDKDNAIIGQIVSPNTPVVTISNDNLEIDTYIPEIDLQKIQSGIKANVTLDAFGLSKIFPATVASIDMAPTNVNGISVYGAKLKFDNQDNSILPGMTANITFTK